MQDFCICFDKVKLRFLDSHIFRLLYLANARTSNDKNGMICIFLSMTARECESCKNHIVVIFFRFATLRKFLQLRDDFISVLRDYPLFVCRNYADFDF